MAELELRVIGEPVDPAFVAFQNDVHVDPFLCLDFLLVKYLSDSVVDDLNGCADVGKPTLRV